MVWDNLPPEAIPEVRKQKADYLRSLPKEVRWRWVYHRPPAYLIQKGVTSPAQGILLAKARLGRRFRLEPWMRLELLNDLLTSGEFQSQS